MKTKLFLLVIIFLVVASLSMATDYYVSPNGSTVWPNCTTQESPCEASNSSKGFLDASAGDIVYFLDGTYSGLEMRDEINAYREPAWFPTNSGTPGEPITFKALNRRQAILVGRQVSTNIEISVIGSDDDNNKSYATWDGFVIKAVASDNTTPLMGAITTFGSGHYTFNDIEVIGVAHDTGGGNNYEGVRIENSTYTTVSNCDIHGWNETSENWNTSAIKTYASYYVDIYNNNFYDNYTHLYIKGYGNGNFDVYNNYFADGNHGIHNTMNLVYTEYNHLYHNNIFNSVDEALSDGGTGESVANDNFFYGNTVYDALVGALIPTSDAGHGGAVYNNIFYMQTDGKGIITRPIGTLKYADHNIYYPALSTEIARYAPSRPYTSLVSWQASGELYTAVDVGCGSNQNPGCGSLLQDPNFANSTGTLSEVADFRVSNTLGRSSGLIGADASLVGTANGGSSTASTAAMGGNSTATLGGNSTMTIQ